MLVKDGGGKWIEKKSVGSPSFEGLKGDFERLRKKCRERGFRNGNC